mmetsp:Transcript_12771/g.19203  ORF Transcript_12771/g.19203 Transcript_12771/m.19203 type:complete len:1005 (+) Transcript_12771:46-3060(+)
MKTIQIILYLFIVSLLIFGNQATIRLRKKSIPNPQAELEQWKQTLIKKTNEQDSFNVNSNNVFDILAKHYEKRKINEKEAAKPGLVFIQFSSKQQKQHFIQSKNAIQLLSLVDHETMTHYIPENTVLVTSKNIYLTLSSCQQQKEIKSCLPFESHHKFYIDPIDQMLGEEHTISNDHIKNTLFSKIIEQKEEFEFENPNDLFRQQLQIMYEVEAINQLEKQFEKARIHNEAVQNQFEVILKPLFSTPEENMKHLESFMKNQNLEVQLLAYSNTIYSVKPLKNVKDTLQTLASYPMLLEVSKKPLFVMTNFAGNQILQSGNGKGDMAMWNLGVTGKNQIVGIGDTGVDWDNCFFADNGTTMKFDEPMPNHRKIYYYHPNVKTVNDSGNIITIKSDTQDYVSGHGTHVAGSVLGDIPKSHPNYNALKNYRGVAPDAKMFFTDIHKPSFPGLLLPSDLYDFFKLPFDNGARIHTDSWGSTINQVVCSSNCECVWNNNNNYGYTPGSPATESQCKDIIGRRCCEWATVYDVRAASADRFLHENKEMMILYAAGNYGRISKFSNLVSPGTAKNVLTVGASITTNANILDVVDHTNFDPIFKALESYGISSTQECCDYTGKNENPIKTLCCPSYAKQYYTNGKEVIFNEFSLSDFTSKGPIPADKRIKPEVVAPGMRVISMFSDGDTTTNQCGLEPVSDTSHSALMSQQGTSMATPLTAGASALVRDYLENHYAPTSGEKLSTIRGELVKAMLIHSAQPLTGNAIVSSQIEPIDQNYPNNQVGFGVINLNTVLRFPSNSSFDLFTYQEEIQAGGDQRTVKCFVTTTDSPLNMRATLTWYDPEGSTLSKVALMNDLELNVFTGNIEAKENTTWYPGNNNTDHDLVNTVEQVRWRVAKKDLLNCVTVQGISYAEGSTQTYALVVTATPVEKDDSKTFIKEIPDCQAPPRPNDSSPLDWRIIWLIILGVIGLLGAFIIVVIGSILVFRLIRSRCSKRSHVPLDSAPEDTYYED